MLGYKLRFRHFKSSLEPGFFGWFPRLVAPLLWTSFGWWIVLLLAFITVGGILGIPTAVFWFRWQNDIPNHKKGFLASGIFGALVSAWIPGLLVLIGTATHPLK